MDLGEFGVRKDGIESDRYSDKEYAELGPTGEVLNLSPPHELTSNTFFYRAVRGTVSFHTPWRSSAFLEISLYIYISLILPHPRSIPLPRTDVPFLPSPPPSDIPMTSVHSTQPVIVPGPSSGSTSKLAHTSLPTYTPPPTSTKRRRSDSVTDADSPSTGIGPIRNTRKDKDSPKKKKAARACIHCQRAHLTCDDCA